MKHFTLALLTLLALATSSRADDVGDAGRRLHVREHPGEFADRDIEIGAQADEGGDPATRLPRITWRIDASRPFAEAHRPCGQRSACRYHFAAVPGSDARIT